MVDAMDVPITESNERWSELKLEDGTIIRVKQSVATVARMDEYDPEGNPVYVVRSTPTVAVIQVPEKLKQKPTTQH